MVFKKLLSSLGFGGVDVDTILSAPSVTPGGPLSGQVQLRAKGDVDIASIQLLLVCTDGRGELELARFPVAGGLRLSGGTHQAVPFTLTTPPAAPFNLLYGQQLPGYTIGVRTEVGVTGGSAKTDFDPVRIEATPVHQAVIDALGTIGCRFVRNELRHGSVAGLPVPAAQAVTFWAPLSEGQQPGPHVPQLTFNFAADEAGTTVVAELTARPGQGDHHRVTAADAQRLSGADEGWVIEVDGWVRQVLEQLSKPAQAPAGSFLQPTIAPPAAAHHGPQQPYGYGGRVPHHGYQYGGYRRGSGVGGAVVAGVGGAALGFLGGMMIGSMLDDAFLPDVAPDAAADAGSGVEDTGGDYAADYGSDSGSDYSSDYGGGFDDFGGGDWGGGEF